MKTRRMKEPKNEWARRGMSASTKVLSTSISKQRALATLSNISRNHLTNEHPALPSNFAVNIRDVKSDFIYCSLVTKLIAVNLQAAYQMSPWKSCENAMKLTERDALIAIPPIRPRSTFRGGFHIKSTTARSYPGPKIRLFVSMAKSALMIFLSLFCYNPGNKISIWGVTDA